MSERTKAIVNLVANCVVAGAGAIMAALEASDSWDATLRPLVLLGAIVAVGSVVRAQLGADFREH